MNRESTYPYPIRSNPTLNYDSDDTVLPSDDEEYHGHRIRHHLPTRHPRKHRKISSLNYPFTPPQPPSPNWSDEGTFVLLEVWGDRFLQLGRSSLRSEDWTEVSDRVSQATRAKIDVVECRNRLNVLKEKYKREKAKIKTGFLGGSGGGVSKWVFFRKMDGLMTMSPRQLQQQEQCGLNCGVDSGEFVFMNPRVYLENSNGIDEMRDSPGNSEEDDEDGDGDSEDETEMEEEEYRLLSKSIKRVGEIYEKVEDSKRCHMMELERLRTEFQRDLEVQKKEIVDQTRVEIDKLRSRRSSNSNSNCEV